MKLIEWINSQGTNDTVELVRRASARPVISTTPQPNIDVQRDPWDSQRRKALRYVMTQAGIMVADLANALTVRNKIGLWVRGLSTVNDKTDVLATYVPIFWDAYVAYREQDVSGEDDELISAPQPDIIVLGDNPATANGWGEVNGEQIEAVIRGQIQ